MKIGPFTLGEWVAITSLIGFVFGVASWLAKKAYMALKDNIVRPLIDMLDEVRSAIREVNSSLEHEKEWIRDRHTGVVSRLNDHEEKIDQHDLEIAKHEERLRTLCEDRKRGYKL